MKNTLLCNGWTVTGKYGIYYDSFSRTRKAAIEGHTAALGRSWAQCRKKGDRVIRTEIHATSSTGNANG